VIGSCMNAWEAAVWESDPGGLKGQIAREIIARWCSGRPGPNSVFWSICNSNDPGLARSILRCGFDCKWVNPEAHQHAYNPGLRLEQVVCFYYFYFCIQCF